MEQYQAGGHLLFSRPDPPRMDAGPAAPLQFSDLSKVDPCAMPSPHAPPCGPWSSTAPPLRPSQPAAALPAQQPTSPTDPSRRSSCNTMKRQCAHQPGAQHQVIRPEAHAKRICTGLSSSQALNAAETLRGEQHLATAPPLPLHSQRRCSLNPPHAPEATATPLPLDAEELFELLLVPEALARHQHAHPSIMQHMPPQEQPSSQDHVHGVPSDMEVLFAAGIYDTDWFAMAQAHATHHAYLHPQPLVNMSPVRGSMATYSPVRAKVKEMEVVVEQATGVGVGRSWRAHLAQQQLTAEQARSAQQQLAAEQEWLAQVVRLQQPNLDQPPNIGVEQPYNVSPDEALPLSNGSQQQQHQPQLPQQPQQPHQAHQLQQQHNSQHAQTDPAAVCITATLGSSQAYGPFLPQLINSRSAPHQHGIVASARLATPLPLDHQPALPLHLPAPPGSEAALLAEGIRAKYYADECLPMPGPPAPAPSTLPANPPKKIRQFGRRSASKALVPTSVPDPTGAEDPDATALVTIQQ